jgi:hypothetical protein
MPENAKRLMQNAERRTQKLVAFDCIPAFGVKPLAFSVISGIVLALQGSKPLHEKGYVSFY